MTRAEVSGEAGKKPKWAVAGHLGIKDWRTGQGPAAAGRWGLGGGMGMHLRRVRIGGAGL